MEAASFGFDCTGRLLEPPVNTELDQFDAKKVNDSIILFKQKQAADQPSTPIDMLLQDPMLATALSHSRTSRRPRSQRWESSAPGFKKPVGTASYVQLRRPSPFGKSFPSAVLALGVPANSALKSPREATSTDWITMSADFGDCPAMVSDLGELPRPQGQSPSGAEKAKGLQVDNTSLPKPAKEAAPPQRPWPESALEVSTPKGANQAFSPQGANEASAPKGATYVPLPLPSPFGKTKGFGPTIAHGVPANVALRTSPQEHLSRSTGPLGSRSLPTSPTAGGATRSRLTRPGSAASLTRPSSAASRGTHGFPAVHSLARSSGSELISPKTIEPQQLARLQVVRPDAGKDISRPPSGVGVANGGAGTAPAIAVELPGPPRLKVDMYHMFLTGKSAPELRRPNSAP
eukprot:gnl/TRDRNA2_/TRDRNA2_202696_c0_seq1.p1 gnl/TRDRNA2_/TRDRNA2_202696_c0~~gnl/TRDRNA2_/TRDRNA2_202696_c0_seq1.p1  ORF type:complete len:445 (+),score=67.31 gnl/TRDRNA2_/TRDRNA2_202696_c0_seq1:125-1336(+)